MGTTPIYGIPYPDPSDLVQNLPQDIEDLALGAEAAISAQAPGGRTPVGRFVFNAVLGGVTNDVFNPTSGKAHFIPLWLPVQTPITELRTALGTVGAAGAVIRMAIYDSDPATGLPGARVLDAGTVAVTAGVGDKAIAVAQTLDAGAYFVMFVTNDAAVRTRAMGSSPLVPATNWLAATGPNNGTGRYITATGYVATNPAPNPATLAGLAYVTTGDCPVVALKAG